MLYILHVSLQTGEAYATAQIALKLVVIIQLRCSPTKTWLTLWRHEG